MAIYPHLSFETPSGVGGTIVDTKPGSGGWPVVELSYQDGRDSPLSTFAVPSLTVTLDNADGWYDPLALAPALWIGQAVRLRLKGYTTLAATVEVLPPGGPLSTQLVFRIDGISTNRGRGRGQVVTITCSAAISREADATVEVGLFYPGAVDVGVFLAAVANGMDYVGLAPSIDPAPLGDPLVASTGTFAQENAFQLMAGVASATGGILYALASGAEDYRYCSRKQRIANAAASWATYPIVIGEGAADETFEEQITYEADSNDIRTVVTFSPVVATGADATVAASTTLMDLLGVRAETIQGPFSTATGTTLASRLLARFAKAYTWPRSVSVNLDFMPSAWASKAITDRYWPETIVAVRTSKPNGTLDYIGCLLEGRELTYSAGDCCRAVFKLTPMERDGAALYGTTLGGGYGRGRYA